MIIQDTDRVLFWLEILAHCLPPEEEEEDMWEAQWVAHNPVEGPV